MDIAKFILSGDELLLSEPKQIVPEANLEYLALVVNMEPSSGLKSC